MMKTTTGASLRINLTAWIVSFAVFAAGVICLKLMPAPEFTKLDLSGGRKPKAVQTVNERIKRDQAQRALPPEYAKQLIKQSEVLVKKNLEAQIRRFQEMSDKMRRNRDELLTKVETRQLPDSAPADANDTSRARAIPQVENTLPGNASVEDFYGLLREYEAEIQQNHLAASAAKQALSKGLSFPEVYNALKEGSTRMPSFEELVKMQTKGGEWSRSEGSTASGSLSVKSTADLNNYRGLLGQTTRQAGLAGSRLSSLFNKGRDMPNGGKQGNGFGNGGDGPGGGSGPGGMGANMHSGQPSTPWSVYEGEKLSKELVKAQALPGRRFSKSAGRKGWLYINTWYMIGPWENFGRDDFVIVHPPELSIDFDAVYTDGQVGTGVEETDSDPIKVIGETVELDGVLHWKFMQSESMHNVVPVTTDHSTYYAYTELFFDEPTTMLVAIGTDDSGRVWINGKDVWQDFGTSWYNIDEHIEPFEFQQGWNRILVRLENAGGSAAGFSFLIVPQE